MRHVISFSGTAELVTLIPGFIQERNPVESSFVPLIGPCCG